MSLGQEVSLGMDSHLLPQRSSARKSNSPVNNADLVMPAAAQSPDSLATLTTPPNSLLPAENRPLSPAACYLPLAIVKDFGWAGRRRSLQLCWIFGYFALQLYLDWFVDQSSTEIDTRAKRLLHRLLRRCWPHGNLAARHQRRAAWLTNKLAFLGPTFIKIGQTLSTRPDLVPWAYTQELAKLQDQVPTFPQPLAWAIIEEELGAPPDKIFASIDPTPIAAASLGQVYQARLKTGELVAVKVQRPLLAATVNLDLAILRQFVTYLENHHSEWTLGLEFLPILDEFAHMLFAEMDYLQEVENAEIFRRHFATWPEIYVPQIYHEYTARRILVEEFIEGTKVDDNAALIARQLVPLEIVKLISRTYLKQLLEDGFFHADPHPGNLRVMPDGRLAFFDFGMVGRLTPQMQSTLVDCFFHIVERDVSGLIEDLVALDFLKEGHDLEEIRPAVEEIFSHYIGKKIGQLKFRELTSAISETVYQFPFTIPAQFTFVMRALTTIEGIGLLIDPSFSFFDTIKPYAKEFMLKREGQFLRDKLMGKLLKGDNGRISWGKVWKLTKMALKHYLGVELPKSSGSS
jgi:predicted unusual protein kinase regulating ubiquinone biosynthesis (AarF/ABC1/UbiB family)